MAIKTKIPEMTLDNDSLTCQRVAYNTVCRNVGNSNIYFLQNQDSGMYHIIQGGNSFATFYNAGDLLEHLRDEDIPDLWNETDLNFVVSIE